MPLPPTDRPGDRAQPALAPCAVGARGLGPGPWRPAEALDASLEVEGAPQSAAGTGGRSRLADRQRPAAYQEAAWL